MPLRQIPLSHGPHSSVAMPEEVYDNMFLGIELTDGDEPNTTKVLLPHLPWDIFVIRLPWEESIELVKNADQRFLQQLEKDNMDKRPSILNDLVQKSFRHVETMKHFTIR